MDDLEFEDVGTGSSPDPTQTGTFSSSFQNPLKVDSLAEFLAEVLRILIMVAWPFIVLAVIYSGFLFVIAQGNEEKLKKAKTAFLWTIVGALLILGAQAILVLLQGTIGNITGQ